MPYKVMRRALHSALLLFVGVLTGATPLRAQVTSSYLRLAVGPEQRVFIQFQGDEMRLSTSEEGLAQAEPVRAITAKTDGKPELQFAQFPEVSLPIPPQTLPHAIAMATVSLRHIILPDHQEGPRAVGGIKFTVTQEDDRTWTYLQTINERTGKDGKSLTTLDVADLANLKLAVKAQVRGKRLGVLVDALGGKVDLSAIRKDGQDATVSVRVLDGNGAVIAAKEGALSDFEFG